MPLGSDGLDALVALELFAGDAVPGGENTNPLARDLRFAKFLGLRKNGRREAQNVPTSWDCWLKRLLCKFRKFFGLAEGRRLEIML
eukprot:2984272-Prymnesium_polylepis.1